MNAAGSIVRLKIFTGGEGIRTDTAEYFMEVGWLAEADNGGFTKEIVGGGV